MRVYITTSLLVVVSLLTLTGCGISYDHTADYTKQKSLIIYPFVNCTDRAILKSDYYNERMLFPRPGAMLNFYTHTNSTINALDDHGYFVIFASDRNEGHVSCADLALAVDAMIPKPISESVYDYAVVVSFDSHTAPALGAIRRQELTLYIFDINASKLIWNAKETEHSWRGIVQGPLESILDAHGGDGDLFNLLGNEIGDAIASAFSKSPLLTSK